jgi:hypothetical protein
MTDFILCNANVITIRQLWGNCGHPPNLASIVDTHQTSHRTRRPEAAGHRTEVVEFVPPTVTSHNHLWAACLLGAPQRIKAAQQKQTALAMDPLKDCKPK